MPTLSPGCHLCFSQAINQRFPWHPHLGSINLQEQLTELKTPVYSLDYQCIMKGYNSGTSRWKRCLGQDIWEGARRFHARLEHTSCPKFPRVHHPRHSPNPLLLGFYGDCTWAWLIKSSAIGGWSQHSPIPLPSQELSRWDRKFHPSNHLVGSLGPRPPSSSASKSPLIHTTKDTFIVLIT